MCSRREKKRMVDPSAKLAPDVQLGDSCVIEAGVSIGAGTVIGHHAVICKDTQIGENVRIDALACVGKLPMQAKNSAVTALKELPPAKIGAGSIIGTSAVLYRGAQLGESCLAADFAVIREEVSVGDLTIIGKGATIENRCTVGKRTKIQTNAYITAYSVVGDDCFIGPCVVTSNDNYAGRTKARFAAFRGVTVLNGGRIGAGAVILPGRTIGEDGLVAAGSVVTHDVPSKTVVAGNPARALKPVLPEQLLENQN